MQGKLKLEHAQFNSTGFKHYKIQLMDHFSSLEERDGGCLMVDAWRMGVIVL